VQAYFDAQSKLDWVEMRKFTSEFDVEESKKQVEMAQKSRAWTPQIDPDNWKAGEAIWSPEQSAWFVKFALRR